MKQKRKSVIPILFRVVISLLLSQNQQLSLAGGGGGLEEEEQGEQDSLMPSDEASDSRSLHRGGSSSLHPPEDEEEEEEEEEEDYKPNRHSHAYRDMYPPNRNHPGGIHSANGHESQNRLLQQRDSQDGHNQRNNRQRTRAWPRDNYWPACWQTLGKRGSGDESRKDLAVFLAFVVVEVLHYDGV